jgi:hypothetical protein
MDQALLRAGDPRYFQLIRDTAAMATSAGQWPEAIHPHTMGGCMGDGHHVWASAEWVLMMRSLFIREEDRMLILGSGLPEDWLRSGKTLSFGPSPTNCGTLTVTVKPSEAGVRVSWEGKWHATPTCVMVKLPGRGIVSLTDTRDGAVEIPHASASPRYQDTTKA